VKTARLRLAGKIVFAAAYVLVAGELFMRILAPQAMLPRYVCATDYGIRGNEPDRSYWHTTPDYRLNIRTNAKGIRAHGEIPYEKPEGVKRIVLLGDSFGMGYGVDLEDTFSSRMVASLEDVGVRCELVNLSVSGFGTAEQLIALEEEGFRYKPDIVLVAWHRTDLEDNIRSNLYALEQGHLSRKSRVYLPAVTTRERLFRFAAYRWLAGSCHLYCCVRERAARLAKFQVIPTIQRLTQIRRKTPENDGDKESLDDTYSAKLALALLTEMQRECHDRGARLLIFSVPTRLSRIEFRSTFPTGQMEDPTQLHIYDPIEDFGRHKGEKLYWEKSHGHFTPLGCRVVGAGLAEYICEHSLLECRGAL